MHCLLKNDILIPAPARERSQLSHMAVSFRPRQKLRELVRLSLRELSVLGLHPGSRI